jgi:hypothetical protein
LVKKESEKSAEYKPDNRASNTERASKTDTSFKEFVYDITLMDMDVR